MWPFFSKNKIPEFTSPVRRVMKLQQLIEKMGDVSDLQTNDIAFKFWLPMPVFESLQEVCEIEEVSQSLFFRNYLFNHCYGLYVVNQILASDAPVKLWLNVLLVNEIKLPSVKSSDLKKPTDAVTLVPNKVKPTGTP